MEYSEKYGRYVLKKSKNLAKDQSYVLYNLPKELLRKVVFPLGDFNSKEEIREIARKNNLKVANKPDSEDICFITDGNYKNFLSLNMNPKYIKKGNIVLKTGEILGKHDGLTNYTIGQRKGLGISYKEPLYVIKLDGKKNQVVVGTEKDLYEKELFADDINWLIFDELQEPLKCYAKIRYKAKEAEAIVYPEENGEVRVEFTEPQKSITSGQSVVFYDEDGVVLGGGKIK